MAILLWLTVYLFVTQSDAGLTFYEFGFFSLCQNNETSNLTSRQIEDARAYSQALESLINESINITIKQRLEEFPGTDIHGSIEYQPFDVCDDFEKLTSLVIEILTDKKIWSDRPYKRHFGAFGFCDLHSSTDPNDFFCSRLLFVYQNLCSLYGFH